jgi:hypothetical protein
MAEVVDEVGGGRRGVSEGWGRLGSFLALGAESSGDEAVG